MGERKQWTKMVTNFAYLGRLGPSDAENGKKSGKME